MSTFGVGLAIILNKYLQKVIWVNFTEVMFKDSVSAGRVTALPQESMSVDFFSYSKKGHTRKKTTT